MTKPVVLISTRSFSTGNVDLFKILNDSGCEVRKISTNHDVNEIKPDLSDAVAWIAGVAPITDEMLSLAPNLKIISRYGVGVDAVDLESAKKRGILVANTPGANSNSVAELALAHILSALRKLPISNSNVRASDWSPIRGQEINGGQIIINTARANLINESDVAEGLRSDKLSFYAADSISNENSVSESPLLSSDLASKTLFTPHLGAQTIEAIDLMGSMAVENVLAVLANKPVRNLLS